jgi:hypothetical protein
MHKEKIIEIFNKCCGHTDLDLTIQFDLIETKNESIKQAIFDVMDIKVNTRVTTFVLESMSGCNGIAISKKVYMYPRYRGFGYGSIFCNLREELSRYFGFASIMCTVVSGNEPQEKIMAKNGWNLINEFYNKKTGNAIKIFSKNL